MNYTDCILLEEPENDTREYTPKASALTIDQDPESDQMFPRRTISDNPEYLELLFTLLSNGEVRDSAWKLLEYLPTNHDIEEELRTFGGSSSGDVNWESLLPSDNVLQLLYRLKIIKGIVDNSTSLYVTSEVKTESSSWVASFLSSDGVKALVSLLTSITIEELCATPLTKTCLAILLTLIARFLQKPEEEEEDDDEDEKSDGEEEAPEFPELSRRPSQNAGKDDEEESPVVEEEAEKVEEVLHKVLGLEDIVGDQDVSILVRRLLVFLEQVAASGDSSEDEKTKEELEAEEREQRRRSRYARYEDYFKTDDKDRGRDGADAFGDDDSDEDEDGEGDEEGGGGGGDEDEDEEGAAAKKLAKKKKKEEEKKRRKKKENEVDLSKLSVEAQVVHSSISLLVELTLNHTQLLQSVLDYPELFGALKYSLIIAKESSLRVVVAKGLLRLSKEFSKIENSEVNPASSFFSSLVPLVIDPLSDSNHSSFVEEMHENSNEFFLFLSKLAAVQNSLVTVNIPDVIRQLSHKIVMREVIEVTEEDEDHFLRGVCILLKSVLKNMKKNGMGEDEIARVKESVGLEEGLIHEIFEHCLFALPTRELQREISDSETMGGEQDEGQSEESDDFGILDDVALAPPPKCKHPQSRSAAFSLLVELSNGCLDGFKEIMRLLGSHHTLTPPREPKDAYSSSSRRSSAVSISSSYLVPKSKSGYAGLKNLGCICYMNSTMQQFAMIPEFVQGIMLFESDTGQVLADGDEPKEEDMKDDLMFQLQTLMVNLQETEKAYANPADFCYSFKDWDGQPVNVMIQQDASEFLTNFFMQIENLTMGSESENVLKDVFGGSLSNELMADGGNYSERPEPFNFISVPVQGKTTLHEGLEEFIAGETVDYTWETEDDKGNIVKESLPTTKRASLRELPHHLIIHLKRFEFNFDAMQQVKINEKFEFPDELNVYPYTVEGRRYFEEKAGKTDNEDENNEDEETGGDCPEGVDLLEYTYELMGVVVHMGTANSGHYYSYIRERTGRGGWFEFNDTLVTDFDLEDLPDETFGGEEEMMYSQMGTGHHHGSSSGGSNYTREKNRNAFVLFYDKKPTTDADKRLRNGPRRFARLPPELNDLTWEQNIHYWRVKNIYDPTYFEAMSSLLTDAVKIATIQGDATDLSGALPLEVLQIASRFALGTLVHAKEGILLIKWCEKLQTIFTKHTSGSAWLIQMLLEDVSTLQNMVLGIEDSKMRGSIVTLISHALVTLARETEGEMATFLETYDPSEETKGEENEDGVDLEVDSSSVESKKPAVFKFLDTLLNNLGVAHGTWRKLNAYFKPLEMLSSSNVQPVLSYMFQNESLGRLLSFFLSSESPYPELIFNRPLKKGDKVKEMGSGSSYGTPDLRGLLSTIHSLISVASIPTDLTGEEEDSDVVLGGGLTLTPKEMEMLRHPSFAFRIVNELKDTSRRAQWTPFITSLCTDRVFINILCENLCMCIFIW